MKFSIALVLLSFIPSVLCDGHTNMTGLFEDAHMSDHNIVEEVTAEIMAEVEAVSDSSTVPANVVYDIATDVLGTYDNEDEDTKAILGHITDAISNLEEINTGESGSVSDFLTELMNTAYGTPAPTSAPTVKVTEETMIDGIKNKITDTTDNVVDTASGIVNSIFNPPPTQGP